MEYEDKTASLPPALPATDGSQNLDKSVNFAHDKDKNTSVKIEIQPEQFQLLLAKLRDEPRKDWRYKLSKGFDVFQKVAITAGISIISIFLAYQEFSGKKKEAQAKTFGELYAEKEETRLGAAAAAVNGLDGTELTKFVQLAVQRFDDAEPRRREYAESGIVNMASFCYETEKKMPIIVDALADGLALNNSQDTKERSAEAAGRIGFPTPHLIESATRLLESSDQQGDVVKEVCIAVKSLKWRDSSRQSIGTQMGALRKAVSKIAQDPAQQDNVQGECSLALVHMPRP